MSCPVCGLRLPLGPALEAHVNAHFVEDDAPPPPPSADVIDLTGDDTHSQGATFRRGNAAAAPRWLSLPPGQLPQLVETAQPACVHAALRRALLAQASSKGPTGVFRAALCGPPLLHFCTAKGVDAGYVCLTSALSPPPSCSLLLLLRPHRWGCGWRNTQMLCAHLLDRKDARSRALFCGSAVLPDVGSLQAWLERAWTMGIDTAGATQFGGAVQGSSQWIGACDAAALLRQFGLNALVVTFKSTGPMASRAHQPEQSTARAQCDACSAFPISRVRYHSQTRHDYDLCGACHASRPDLVASYGPFTCRPVPPDDADDAPFGHVEDDVCMPGSHKALLEWMWKYFTTAEAGQTAEQWPLGQQVYVARSRHPLFLQHAGHSRTVVGIERRPRKGGGSGGDGSDQWSLLVLDPGADAAQVRAALASPQAWPRLVKRGAHTLLKRREYQVLVVPPAVVEGASNILRALAVLDETPPEAVFAP
jgi:hypothetical protein